jgi:hypothetical protein
MEITALLDKNDVTDMPLAHDGETTRPAQGLLGSLLTKTKDSQPLVAKDAKDFLGRYSKQQSGLAGKQQNATGGSTRFRGSSVQELKGAVDFLEQRNALQPEELDQVSSLTRQLAPGNT